MREQLELLWELQKIDLELKSIKEGRDRYPKEMKKLEEKQKIERERIQKEKEKVESLEKTRRQKEGQLNLEQEKIKRAEAKMFEVKTNKEYQALLSEIDAIKGANSRMEEEILRVMDEIDELKKDLSKREKDVGATLEKIEQVAEFAPIGETILLDGLTHAGERQGVVALGRNPRAAAAGGHGH